jgi:hypothetical protein
MQNVINAQDRHTLNRLLGTSLDRSRPKFRSNPLILPLLLAILAPTCRNIAENVRKSKTSNQNNSREPKSAPNLLKTAEKSATTPSNIKQK